MTARAAAENSSSGRVVLGRSSQEQAYSLSLGHSGDPRWFDSVGVRHRPLDGEPAAVVELAGQPASSGGGHLQPTLARLFASCQAPMPSWATLVK